MSDPNPINVAAAAVSLATSIFGAGASVSPDPSIAQAGLEVQAEIASEGYELATEDDSDDD